MQYVNAGFQSYAYDIIAEQLTEEETEIFKRGRNATGNNVPRSSNPKDYRRATGMEALFGYLYLTGQNDRIKELLKRYIQASVHNSREKDYNEGNNKTHAD